jgi:hypothetical protein
MRFLINHGLSLFQILAVKYPVLSVKYHVLAVKYHVLAVKYHVLAVKYHGFMPSVSSALFTHSSVSSHQVHGLLNFLLLPSHIHNPIRLAPYCLYSFTTASI